MRKVNVECPGGQNVTFQFSYVAGNNNGTSVEDGQIPEIIFYTWNNKRTCNWSKPIKIVETKMYMPEL